MICRRPAEPASGQRSRLRSPRPRVWQAVAKEKAKRAAAVRALQAAAAAQAALAASQQAGALKGGPAPTISAEIEKFLAEKEAQYRQVRALPQPLRPPPRLPPALACSEPPPTARANSLRSWPS